MPGEVRITAGKEEAKPTSSTEVLDKQEAYPPIATKSVTEPPKPADDEGFISLTNSCLDQISYVPVQFPKFRIDSREEDINTEIVLGEGRDVLHPLPLASGMYLSGLPISPFNPAIRKAMLIGALEGDIPIFSGPEGMLPDEVELISKARGKWVLQWSPLRHLFETDLLEKADGVCIDLNLERGLSRHLQKVGFCKEVLDAAGLSNSSDVPMIDRHMDLLEKENLTHHVELLRELTGHKVPIMVGIGPSNLYKTVEMAIDADADAILLSQDMFSHSTLPLVSLFPQVIRAFRDNDGVQKGVKLLVNGDFFSASDVVKGICLGADAVGLSALALRSMGCRFCPNCTPQGCKHGLLRNSQSTPEDPGILGKGLGKELNALKESLLVELGLLGSDDIATLEPINLRALTYDVAAMTGLRLAGYDKPLAMWLH